MITNEILLSIDNINSATEDASFHVLESVVSYYSKEIDFEDFCSPEIVMEGQMIDNVKKKEKKDSNKLVSFLLFIPRIIGEICKAIGKAFADSALGKKLRKIGSDMDKAATEKEKRARVEEFNAASDGKLQAYYDEKSGKIKFKKTADNVIGVVQWLAGSADDIYTLFKNIKDEFDVSSPSAIRTFVDECEKILRGKREHSKADVVDMGFDALADLVGHISKSTDLLTNAGSAASAVISRKIKAMELNDEDPERHTVLMLLKELANKLSTIAGSIAVVTTVGNTIKKYSKYASMILHHHEDESKLVDDAQNDIVEAIYTQKPELQKKHPKGKDEDEEAYKQRIAQHFFLDLVEDQKPDLSAEEQQNIADKMYADALKKRRDERKEIRAEELAEEYRQAALKYYTDKQKLREENPTIFEKRKAEKAERKAEKAAEKEAKKADKETKKNEKAAAKEAEKKASRTGGITKESAEIEVDEKEVVDEDFGDHVNYDYDNVEDEIYGTSIKDSLLGKGPMTKTEEKIYKFFGGSDFRGQDQKF